MSIEYWEMTPDQLKSESDELLTQHNSMRDSMMLARKQKLQGAMIADMSRKCAVLDHKRFMINKVQSFLSDSNLRVLTSNQSEMIYIVSLNDYDTIEVKYTTHYAKEAFEFFLLERDSVNNIDWYKMGRQD